MVNLRVDSVYLNVTGGNLHSRNVNAEIQVGGNVIRDTDISRISQGLGLTMIVTLREFDLSARLMFLALMMVR